MDKAYGPSLITLFSSLFCFFLLPLRVFGGLVSRFPLRKWGLALFAQHRIRVLSSRRHYLGYLSISMITL